LLFALGRGVLVGVSLCAAAFDDDLHERRIRRLSSFNGIGIDQRRDYVKVSCQSYLVSMLKTHGWDKPSLTEKSDSKPIGRFHWAVTTLVLSDDSWYGIG
jgi:hypothetical protein